ncbi:MAG: sigma-70 family RNA polymerase sigma factor, partial [Clostridia bacterium]|nr:sigma-70 family RNA polymerase sigma factor [Clostridia bacterium]
MEQLVIENAGLVRSLAQRFCGRGTEFEDLIQIGTIGMIKAVRSFSLERGTAFSTYAVPLIVGEIRRHLRDDGMIKVS